MYGSMIHALRLLRPVIGQIERHDRDLGNQLRRCAASVALNLSEGSGSRGGNRTVRYRSALGSVQETAACIDVAMALGYIESVDGEIQRSLEAVRRGVVSVVGEAQAGAPA